MAVTGLIAGRISSFVALILIAGVIVYYILRASSFKKIPELRRIAGIEAIDDAVKRCAELGRPIHFTLGIGGLNDPEASQTIAAIGVMTYATRLAAQLNIDSIVTVCIQQLMPAVEEIVRQNYEVENAEFKPSYVRYSGPNQAYLALAIQGIMERESPGANFMMGFFDEEAIAIAEKGYRTGSIGIGGTTTIGQMGILAATMDYFLIGEELYAVGAYLSKDRLQIMSIAAIDNWKVVALVAIVVGFVLVNFGSNIINTLLEF